MSKHMFNSFGFLETINLKAESEWNVRGRPSSDESVKVRALFTVNVQRTNNP